MILEQHSRTHENPWRLCGFAGRTAADGLLQSAVESDQRERADSGWQVWRCQAVETLSLTLVCVTSHISLITFISHSPGSPPSTETCFSPICSRQMQWNHPPLLSSPIWLQSIFSVRHLLYFNAYRYHTALQLGALSQKFHCYFRQWGLCTPALLLLTLWIFTTEDTIFCCN